MKKFTKRLVACAVAAGLAAPMTAMATNGYHAHGYGMKNKGRAGAGVAMSDDAMAIAVNPAAGVKAGDRMDIGLEIFMPDRSSRANNAPTFTDQNDEDTFYIPEFAYNKMLSDTSAFGIAIYGNGGMNTSATTTIYDAAAGGGSGVNRPTKSSLSQLFIAPTYSMKIDDKHSIGVSVNLAIQEFEANGLGNFSVFKEDTQTTDDGLTDQGKDHSFGLGFKLGWQGEVSDGITLGVAYQTETEMSRFDSYNKLFAGAGEFNIPSTWTIGVAWKAMPKLNVAFDVHQINYSDIPALANKNCGYTNPHPGNCDLGDPNGPGFGWDDITVYRLGVDYDVSDNLVVRAGFSHGDQPISSTETAFNVIAPAVVEDHLTVGATWTMANNDELTVMYMHAFENEVLGTTTPCPGSAGCGDVKMSQDSLGVSYGLKF